MADTIPDTGSDPVEFIHRLHWSDLPAAARHHARRCMLDTVGVAAGGLAMAPARMVRDHVAACQTAGPGTAGARMLFDGRRVSPPGAAMAGACTIDALDGHDGFNPVKGHIGVVALPVLLAVTEELAPCGGAEFLARFALAYEIGGRAGQALHATVSDYHTSGAWNAVAGAAMAARALGLDRERTRHALGIAEYWGPRSQMMRVIDHPSNLKDGSTLGAQVAVTAALLARDGFTGAPAVTVERADAAPFWTDLGSRWQVAAQYLKPFPVCRWAQPALFAALALRPRILGHLGLAPDATLPPDELATVTVHGFAAAVRLSERTPADSDQAQYSLPFPLAALLVWGRLTPTELDGPNLHDPTVLGLTARIGLVEDPAFTAAFPADRQQRVDIVLMDGTRFDSGPTRAKGDAADPLTDVAVLAKFHGLADPVLGRDRADRIAGMVLESAEPPVAQLLDLLQAPTSPAASVAPAEARA